jgi:hypothetical protein
LFESIEKTREGKVYNKKGVRNEEKERVEGALPSSWCSG